MTYSVKTTNEGSTITVATGEVSTKYGVALVGRNVSGYGQFFVQNTLWMLENFASSSSPVARGDTALVGQHWYNTTDNTMRVYDGTVWRRQTPLISSSAPTSDLGQGTSYFDTVDNKERIYDGTTWRDVSYPGTITSRWSAEKGGSTYGTRTRTLYLTDNTSTKRAVTALVYVNDGTSAGYTSNETIMAIFSDYPNFTLTESSLSTSYRDSESAPINLYAEFNDANGIGLSIRRGMNLRRAYSDTSVPLADLAVSATSANALLVGADIITSSNFFHTGSSSIAPTATDTVNIGESTARFNNAYLGGDIVIGDATAGLEVVHTIRDAGGLAKLSVGTSTDPVKTLYVDDIHMSGTIVGFGADTIETIGSSSNPMDTAHLSNVSVTATQNITTNGVKGFDLKATDGTVIFDASTGSLQNTSLSKVITQDTDSGLETFSYNGSANVAISVDNTVIRTTGTQTLAGAKSFTAEIGATAGVNATGQTVKFGSLSDGTITITDFIDEDTMVSNSAVKVPTQQSVKAYVDAQVAGKDNTDEITEGSTNLYFTNARADARITKAAIDALNVDADTLDSLNSTSFLRSDAADTHSHTITPGSTNAINLGSSALKYANVYATTFQGVATTAQYADMAEIYSADADYEAGTVVKIGGDAEITMTTDHADTEVFGVISTNPAYLMNSEAEGLPVALAGRVPVKVVGKIAKGQRLVSSDIPGVAWASMENEYDTRAIIGRSLQDKDSAGEGLVEAVIGVR
tara:strand:+ start:174 stop:2414 length:2241 start_codon:yes stop_codon:yes gene_type:complete